MIPEGGMFSLLIDYKRDRAKLIPIGPNKGESTLPLKLRLQKPFTRYIIYRSDNHKN